MDGEKRSTYVGEVDWNSLTYFHNLNKLFGVFNVFIQITHIFFVILIE